MRLPQTEVEPLIAGDHLSRQEFLRRWEAMPGVKKAELIHGVVFMPSPVTVEHGDHENMASGWLCNYSSRTPGTRAGNNATTLLLDDAPQPDVHLRILQEHGGKSWVEDSYLRGAPELVVEVCRSSAAYDLHEKKALYAAGGVQEYLAVLILEHEVQWFRLVRDHYQLIERHPDGTLRSIVYPGLWLAPEALLALDSRRVFAALETGLASPEHQTFLRELERHP